MRQVEIMGNPRAKGFDKGVNRYRAQRALGNEQGDIPCGKVLVGGFNMDSCCRDSAAT